MIDFIFRFMKTHKQFVTYGVIGVTGATIDYLLFLFLTYIIHLNPGIASFISVCGGIINNFLLNYFFNFRTRNRFFERLINFLGIGLVGALLSAILIIILCDGLGIASWLSKLLTIPPIVLAQYFFNKRFSFREKIVTLAEGGRFIRRHIIIVTTIIFFTLTSLFFVKQIPSSGNLAAPDETIHFGYNVKFIIDNHRLPVSGQDDLKVISSCNGHDAFNYVQCTYSYQSFIGANYGVYSGFAWIVHHLTNISYLKSARLLSTIYGIVFILFIYLSILKITKKPTSAGIITASIGFIPQLIFTFSYVNQDAHSLALAAVTTFFLCRFLLGPSKRTALPLGIFIGGLLPLAKYNYFIIAPAALISCLYAVRIGKVPKRLLGHTLVWAILAFLVVAAPWYIRNLLLYHDLLGQSFMLNQMSQYHSFGMEHGLFALDTIKSFLKLDFLTILFQSFFVALGMMYVYLPQWVYSILQVVLIGLLVDMIWNIITSRKMRLALPYITCLFIFIVIAVLQVYINSVKFDYQPQGRYLYVILPVVGIVVAKLHSLVPRSKVLLYLLVFSIFLIMQTIDLVLRSYL